MLGIEIANLPFYYLGAPISKGRKKIELFIPLIDKIRSKLSGWNLNFLSQGGRCILIKSVLTSMPVYLLQVTNPPVAVYKLIDSMLSKFVWGTNEKGKKNPLVQMETCLFSY